MSFAQLRRNCESRLQDLQIPEPFDIDVLCDMLAKRRGRPMRFTSLPEPRVIDTPSALWIAYEDEDVIFVEDATSPFHREHLIAHELGHMLCNHVTPLRLEGDYAKRLVPDLDPDLIKLMLGRTSYTTEQEREAETLATLILSRARRAASDPPAARADIADAVARATQTFWQPRP
jgi:hypothetical protein